MILSELIAFLNQIDAAPKKRLSQNFLIDPNIVKKIVHLAQIDAHDTVLEIGPGPGALTKALLETGARVYAVEIDSLFAQHLHRFQNGKLSIFEYDFLKFPLELIPQPVKVVANLPYHITTPILEKLFSHPFISLTLMLQQEVAERIQARPGTKEFGSLSLFVEFHSKIHGSFAVPSNCFYPKPKVGSTVIRLDSTPIPEENPFPLIRPAFQHRRKMLSGTLPFPKDQIQNTLNSLGIRPDARPEMLSLSQWQRLSRALLEGVVK